MAEIFKDKLGRDIELVFDETELTCEANYKGNHIGAFRFREHDEDDSSVLLMTHFS